jgi:hypothetical protein
MSLDYGAFGLLSTAHYKIHTHTYSDRSELCVARDGYSRAFQPHNMIRVTFTILQTGKIKLKKSKCNRIYRFRTCAINKPQSKQGFDPVVWVWTLNLVNYTLDLEMR